MYTKEQLEEQVKELRIAYGAVKAKQDQLQVAMSELRDRERNILDTIEVLSKVIQGPPKEDPKVESDAPTALN